MLKDKIKNLINLPSKLQESLNSEEKIQVIAKDFFLTFLVITDPAPTILSLSIFNGATNDEFDPIKTLSEIFVLDFFTPS